MKKYKKAIIGYCKQYRPYIYINRYNRNVEGNLKTFLVLFDLERRK